MAKCVPCMAESLKDIIREFTDDPHTLKQVDEIATCSLGEIMELCGGKTGGRKPSAYNEFISQCMKGKPIKGKPFGTASKYMKECSEEWKALKP